MFLEPETKIEMIGLLKSMGQSQTIFINNGIYFGGIFKLEMLEKVFPQSVN